LNSRTLSSGLSAPRAPRRASWAKQRPFALLAIDEVWRGESELLIGRCLHTSLVAVALRQVTPADHVVHRGLAFERLAAHACDSGSGIYVCHQYLVDFIGIMGRNPYMPGVIILVPSVAPASSTTTVHRRAETHWHARFDEYGLEAQFSAIRSSVPSTFFLATD